jgi:hypothetical protein
MSDDDDKIELRRGSELVMITPKDLEDLLEAAVELDAELQAAAEKEDAELDALTADLKPAQEISWEEYDARMAEGEERKKQAIKALQRKGVRLNIGACGCCDSPWVSIEIDGELLIDDEDRFELDMIDRKPE